VRLIRLHPFIEVVPCAGLWRCQGRYPRPQPAQREARAGTGEGDERSGPWCRWRPS